MTSNTLKNIKNPLFCPNSTFFEKSKFFKNPKSKSPNTPGHSPLCCTPGSYDSFETIEVQFEEDLNISRDSNEV